MSWWQKIPWAKIGEVFIGWWNSRKKDDSNKGDSQVQKNDDKPSVDTK